jgi:hypothetical protein
MRTPVLLLLFLLVAGRLFAQELTGPGSLPIEITATGDTTSAN